MRGSTIVFIYGPPGVGKLTVAKELSRLTGFKLFDNHVTIDWVKPYFEFGSERFWRLVSRLRVVMLEEAARADLSMIMTFVYDHGEDLTDLDHVCDFDNNEGGRASFVQLICDRSTRSGAACPIR